MDRTRAPFMSRRCRPAAYVRRLLVASVRDPLAVCVCAPHVGLAGHAAQEQGGDWDPGCQGGQETRASREPATGTVRRERLRETARGTVLLFTFSLGRVGNPNRGIKSWKSPPGLCGTMMFVAAVAIVQRPAVVNQPAARRAPPVFCAESTQQPRYLSEGSLWPGSQTTVREHVSCFALPS